MIVLRFFCWLMWQAYDEKCKEGYKILVYQYFQEMRDKIWRVETVFSMMHFSLLQIQELSVDLHGENVARLLPKISELKICCANILENKNSQKLDMAYRLSSPANYRLWEIRIWRWHYNKLLKEVTDKMAEIVDDVEKMMIERNFPNMHIERLLYKTINDMNNDLKKLQKLLQSVD